jgi:hypothetical protein
MPAALELRRPTTDDDATREADRWRREREILGGGGRPEAGRPVGSVTGAACGRGKRLGFQNHIT